MYIFPSRYSFFIRRVIFKCTKTLARQAQKAIFKLNYYLIEFTDVTPKHTLDLFDKLVSPILNYAAEVCGFLRHHELKGAFTVLQKIIGG